jgi:hypothetical protein
MATKAALAFGVVVALAAAVAGVAEEAVTPEPPAALAVSCGTKPAIRPGSCIQDYRCSPEGSWEDVYKAIGAACNDNNACTYNDACVTTYGTCRGTPVTCDRPCELCNGTVTCGARPSGTTCPVSTTNPCEAVCDGVSPYCQPR